MQRPSRREVLRAGLAAAVVTPGCTSLDSLSAPSETGTYLDWLPAPDAIDTSPYGVTMIDVDAYENRRGTLHPATRFLVDQKFVARDAFLREVLGPATQLVTFTDSMGAVVVREGVERTTPGEALRSVGYRATEEYGVFTIHDIGQRREVSPNAPRVVATGAPGVVHTPEEDPLPVERSKLKAVLDARRGEAPRYHDDEEVGPVAEAVGEGTFTRLLGGRRGQPFSTVVASGQGWHLGQSRTSLRWVLRFEDEADARVADVPTRLAPTLAAYDDVTATRDGATVDVRASLPTEQFDLGFPGDPGDDGIPRARFAIEWLGSTARVTHAEGQPVPADRLIVTVDDYPTDRQFADGYETVEEGDSLTVSLNAGRDVAVVWHHPDADETLTLGSTVVAA